MSYKYSHVYYFGVHTKEITSLVKRNYTSFAQNDSYQYLFVLFFVGKFSGHLYYPSNMLSL